MTVLQLLSLLAPFALWNHEISMKKVSCHVMTVLMTSSDGWPCKESQWNLHDLPLYSALSCWTMADPACGVQAKASMTEVRHLPMLVPPAPWKTPFSGGHVLTPACIMRGYEERLADRSSTVNDATYATMPEVIQECSHFLPAWGEGKGGGGGTTLKL